jgi:hypothetical protein
MDHNQQGISDLQKQQHVIEIPFGYLIHSFIAQLDIQRIFLQLQGIISKNPILNLSCNHMAIRKV